MTNEEREGAAAQISDEWAKIDTPPAKELLALFPPVTVMAEGALVPETPVTPEMIAAGLAAMSDDPMVTDCYDAERLYRAMHAYRPVVTDPRNASAEIARLHDELKALTDERDVMRDEMGTQAMRMVSLLNSATMMNDAIKTLEARVAAREARICELDDLLAQRPESVPDTPKPVHDFTRVEGGDRRRVGG